MQDLARRPRVTIDVLVVDDDKDTSDTVADILTGEGYTVSIAESGLQALEFMQRNPAPKLILLDLFMPDMGGVEFISYRKGSKWENVPIVILSALEKASPPPGWTGLVLEKPCSPRQLLTAIHLNLPSKRQ